MRFTRKGFTLIEVIVAISLMTALSGVLMAQFGGYTRTQEAKMASERLRQVITEAKTNVLAGKKDCYICGGADHTCNGVDDAVLVGWRVGINSPIFSTEISPTNGYQIGGICHDTTDKSFMVRTENFGSNATVTGLSVMTFLPINKGTDLANPVYITILGTDGSYNTFSVTTAGNILQ